MSDEFSRRDFMMSAGVAMAAAPGATPQPALAAGKDEHAPIKPYLAMAVQSKVIAAKGMSEVHQNLEHVLKLIDQYMKGVWQLSGGGAPKLVVFPESFLHGFGPMGTRTFETNSRFALRIPGEETRALGEKCKQYGFYLAGAAFEKVDEFPNHFFNTGFIIDPQGRSSSSTGRSTRATITSRFPRVPSTCSRSTVPRTPVPRPPS